MSCMNFREIRKLRKTFCEKIRKNMLCYNKIYLHSTQKKLLTERMLIG